jgi:two-component system chemotaxis response regulator CheB
MGKIRVFLVDDAVVIRRLVTSALNRDPSLEVVGAAPNGRVALARLPELRPDVVLLDLEMPEMDGLATLAALRKTHPRLPVIMFSRFTQRGVEATVSALMLGADDYVAKPGDGLDVERCVQDVLIPKLKLLGQRTRGAGEQTGQAGRVPPSRYVTQAASPGAGQQRVEAVVIGASTGGPNALAVMFPAFPPDWAVPTLIVQHMPADFTARLAVRLAEKARLRVREAVTGEPISAAQAWVAPGNHHLTLHRDGKQVRLALNQDPPVNSCRPSADVLFSSAAEVYGPGVLAVVLTGLGQDGLRGCECVRAAGGQVLVQDEASSVVWSMPGVVAQAGLADEVLPLDRLGLAIVGRTGPRSGTLRAGPPERRSEDSCR